MELGFFVLTLCYIVLVYLSVLPCKHYTGHYMCMARQNWSIHAQCNLQQKMRNFDPDLQTTLTRKYFNCVILIKKRHWSLPSLMILPNICMWWYLFRYVLFVLGLCSRWPLFAGFLVCSTVSVRGSQ